MNICMVKALGFVNLRKSRVKKLQFSVAQYVVTHLFFPHAQHM